jgi:hypothetical protein
VLPSVTQQREALMESQRRKENSVVNKQETVLNGTMDALKQASQVIHNTYFHQSYIVPRKNIISHSIEFAPKGG